MPGCFGRRKCNVNLDDLRWDRPDLDCEPQQARDIPAIFNWTRPPGPRTKPTPAEPPRPHANRGQLPNSPTLSRSSRKITDAPHARAGDRADHDDGAQVGQTAVGDTARETSGRGAPERVNHLDAVARLGC